MRPLKQALGLGLCAAVLAAPASAATRNLFIAATDGFAYLPSDNTVPDVTGLGTGLGVSPQSAERKYYIRGFCDDVDGTQATPGCAMLPAPIIDVNQNDDVFIQLRNVDNANPVAPKDPHTIHLHGIHATSQNDGFPETSWEVPETAGENVGTYYFRAESPGTYMWHCHVEASEHVQMGMYGAMIVRPKRRPAGSVYGGLFNDKFDHEYIVLLSDVETTAHDAIQSDFNAAVLPGGISPDTTADAIDNYNFVDFRANAWLVNGRGFPDTVRPTSTAAADQACATDPTRSVDMGIDFDGCNPEFSGPPSGFLTGANNLANYAPLVEANLDKRILLRVINMGYNTVPWHIHGWHFRAVGKDARPIPRKSQVEEFTLTIGSGETYDLVIDADDRTKVGKYRTASNFSGATNAFAQALDSCPGGVPCDTSMDGITDDYWFPMHNHEDFTVTNFGAYPGGQLSLIHVAPGLVP